MKLNPVRDKYNSPAYWTQLIQLAVYDMVNQYLSNTGLTPEEFAEKAGVAKSSISQILNGDFDHNLSELVKIVLACDMIPHFEFINKDFITKQ